MKEVTKEFKETKTYKVYQAADGTEFMDPDNCLKYEKSASGVIKAKLAKLLISATTSLWDIWKGEDDHHAIVFKPETQEDVDNIMQFVLLENPWYNNEDRKEDRDSIYSSITAACTNKDIVILGKNYDGNYYFINSRQNIINNLMNLDKKEEE